MMRNATIIAMAISIALLCTAAAFAEELPDGVQVIDCLWPDRVPLGATALYRALIINNGERRLVVVAPRIQQDSQKARFFVGRGSPCQYQVMKARGIPFVPSRELEALGPGRITLEPGEMGTWDVPLPAPGADEPPTLGKHHVSVDLALGYPAVPGKTAGTPGSRYPAKGVIVIKNIDSQDPSKWSVPSAIHHEFSSAYTLTDPSGKDKVYYERYLETWLQTHDCDDYVQTVLRMEEVRRSLSQKMNEAGPSSPPFSEIKQRQSFKELEDNRYAALAGYGGGSKITLLDTVRNLSRMSPGRVKYQYSPSLLNNTVVSFERAKYFVREFGLKWQAYLGSAVGLLGTAEEERALKAIQEVAASSPDCVARYLAQRVLEVYDEVRGGKSR